MQHSHLLLPSDFFLVGVVDSQVVMPVLSFVVALERPTPARMTPILRQRWSRDPVRYSLVRFVETVQYSLEIMLLNGSQSLPDKPIGSAITSDQLVTLSSGGFAFLYIPSQQLHYQIPQIIQLPLNPLEQLAHARPIGLRCTKHRETHYVLQTMVTPGSIRLSWKNSVFKPVSG
ncbi:hypothetical protein QWA68_007621 [Fusarium oxysporum]|nr:hypothetical protein QWA68_007621 [Fusarium oxysporum]